MRKGDFIEYKMKGMRMVRVVAHRAHWQDVLGLAVLLFVIILVGPTFTQDNQRPVELDWDKTIVVSKTTPTLQVVTNPDRELSRRLPAVS